jgi:protein disulfide-isomerase A6
VPALAAKQSPPFFMPFGAFGMLPQWCGFCKRLKDTWIELATAVKGKAKVGAVDCTQHKAVCSKYSVRGYPTLKKFGADKASPEDYAGDRSLGDLASFVTGEKAAPAKEEDSKEEL